MFPGIFKSINLVNLIKINSSKKNLYFDLQFTKNNLILLKLLKNLNFINKFILIKFKNKILLRIFLYYYRGSDITKNFKIISTKSKKFPISIKSLKLLKKKSGSSIFIISTSKGLITQEEAIKLNISGILIGFFSL